MDCKQLDRYIRQQMIKCGVPGMAIALTDRERVLWSAEYGYADIKTKKRVNQETLFELGSITKSFTAIALLKEWERNKLDLNAPVSNYLKWFKVKNRFEPITIHHLLSHTASLPLGRDDIPSSVYMAVALSQYELQFSPGTYYVESNVGYQVLGYLLEEIEGKPYDQIIQETIFKRLGMKLSQAKIINDTRKQMAEGYNYLYDDRPRHAGYPLVQAPFIEYYSGDGCIASTAVELCAYLRLLLNRGQINNEKMISEKTFSKMTGRIAERWTNSYYGYGIFSRIIDDHNIIGHGGDMIGFQSMMLGDVEDGCGAVVLVNGPGFPFYPALYALRLMREQLRSGKKAEVPVLPISSKVKNYSEYLGNYKGDTLQFNITQANGHLIMDYNKNLVILESRGDDYFFVDHPDFAIYLLKFERNLNGEVVKAFYGADCYANERFENEPSSDIPHKWDCYVGHYRTQNPWNTNFRIIIRENKLLKIEPGSISNDSNETILNHIKDSLFMVGEEDDSTEWILFEDVVDGKALRLSLTGCNYYRCPTP